MNIFHCKFCNIPCAAIKPDLYNSCIETWNCSHCKATYYDNHSIGLEVILGDKIYKIYVYHNHTSVWEVFPIRRSVLELRFHIDLTPQNIKYKLPMILLFS